MSWVRLGSGTDAVFEGADAWGRYSGGPVLHSDAAAAAAVGRIHYCALS